MKNNGTKRKSGKKPLLREEINRRGFSEKKLEAEIELKRMMQKKKNSYADSSPTSRSYPSVESNEEEVQNPC